MPVTIGDLHRPGRHARRFGPSSMDRYNRSYEYDGLGPRYARFWSTRSCRKSASSTSSRRDPNDRAIAGSSSRRNRRLRRGLGAARRLPPRAQLRRQLHQPARRRHPDRPECARSSPNRCASSCRTARTTRTSTRATGTSPTRGSPARSSTRVTTSSSWSATEGHNSPSRLGDPSRCAALALAGVSEAGRERRPEVDAALHPRDPRPGSRLGGSRVEGYQNAEGASVDAEGSFYFCDSGASKIYKVGADGKPVVVRENTGGARNVTVGPDGSLYAADGARRRVVAYRPDGKTDVLATGGDPTEVVVTSKGTVYYLDFEKSRVWLIQPKASPRIVAEGDLLGAEGHSRESRRVHARARRSPGPAGVVVSHRGEWQPVEWRAVLPPRTAGRAGERSVAPGIGRDGVRYHRPPVRGDEHGRPGVRSGRARRRDHPPPALRPRRWTSPSRAGT